MLSTPISPAMHFAEAAKVFLAMRSAPNAAGRVQYIAPRTLRDLGVYLGTLTKFFGALRLDEIHIGHIASYQKARAVGDGFTRKLGKRELTTIAGAAKINDELGVLKRVMLAGAVWTPALEALYMPLQEPESEDPKALSEEEEARFLATAGSNPRWHVIWWYSLVARHTSFSSDEMRTIRQGDINLALGLLGVNRRYGKNRYRRRDVALTDGACLWGLERLLERARTLGGEGPHLHLFPRRVVKNHYDGTRPMSETGIRKDFEEVRDAAGVPWFCLNMWRHTAITRMAESGTPIAIIQRRAGHMSPRMTNHYTHISEAVERREMERLDRLNRRKPPASIGDRSAWKSGSAG